MSRYTSILLLLGVGISSVICGQENDLKVCESINVEFDQFPPEDFFTKPEISKPVEKGDKHRIAEKMKELNISRQNDDIKMIGASTQRIALRTIDDYDMIRDVEKFFFYIVPGCKNGTDCAVRLPKHSLCIYIYVKPTLLCEKQREMISCSPRRSQEKGNSDIF